MKLKGVGNFDRKERLIIVQAAEYSSTKANFDELEDECEMLNEALADHLVGSHGKINKRLTALEAKDAPEKIYRKCWRCEGSGWDFPRRLSQKCPSCEGTGIRKQPHPTCGNCNEPARFDGHESWHEEVVVCANRTGKLEIEGINDKACPHHERREA